MIDPGARWMDVGAMTELLGSTRVLQSGGQRGVHGPLVAEALACNGLTISFRRRHHCRITRFPHLITHLRCRGGALSRAGQGYLRRRGDCTRFGGCGRTAEMIRALASILALNRVLFGLGYIVAPDRVGGGWIGRQASRPQTKVLTRALGARDLVLGLGALRALRSEDAAVRTWFAAHTVADGTDLVATIIARDELPTKGFRFATAMAGASTAIAALGTARPGGRAERSANVR